MEPIQLTINDLIAIRGIIDTACQRGAFKANEMAVIGSTYDRLDSFVNDIMEQAEAQSASENSQGESQ
jgi:hypothetical protein